MSESSGVRLGHWPWKSGAYYDMEPSLIFSVFTDNLERENVRAFSNANPGTCFSEGNMIFSIMFSYFLFIFLVTKK